MNRILKMSAFVIIAIATVPFCVFQSAKAQETEWQTDINAAIEIAVQEQKPILMHFTADWCRPCKQLETFVFTSPLVQNAIRESVIPVKVDVDLHKELAKEFSVTGVPFDVLVTTSGRVITKRKSPLAADGYIKMLQGIKGSAAKGKVAERLAKVQEKLSENAELASKNEFPMPKQKTLETPQHLQPEHKFPSNELAKVRSNADNQFAASTQNKLIASKTDSKRFPVKSAAQMRIVGSQNQVASARIRNPYVDDETETVNPLANHQSMEEANDFAPSIIAESNQLAGSSIAESKPDSLENDFQVIEPKSTPAPATMELEVAKAEPAPKIDSPATGIARIKTDSFDKPAEKKSGVTTRVLVDNSMMSTLGKQTNPTVNQERDLTNSFTPNQLATTEPPKTPPTNLALHGKCPVTLMNEGKWIDGDKHWGCVHRGQTYLFASLKKLESFQADPDRFSPLLAGFDPVIYRDTGKLVKGHEKNGVFMGRLPDQRVILFNNMETRSKFQSNPSIYIDAIRQAMIEAQRETTLR